MTEERNPPPPGWTYIGGPDSDWIGWDGEGEPPAIPENWSAWNTITANIAKAFGPNYRPYQPDLKALRPGSIVRAKRD